MKAAARIGGIVFVALAGCGGGVKEAPVGVYAPLPLAVHSSLVRSNQIAVIAAEPPRAEAVVLVPQPVVVAPEAVALPPQPALAQPAAPAASSQPATTGAVAIQPGPSAASPPKPSTQGAAKDAAIKAPAPAKLAAAAPAVEQPRKSENPPPARNTEPLLDVDALKARLRDTKAIGVFTKLALKNQMDDLLKQFRERHQSGQNRSIASLRQPFDMLVLKVLAVVQDNDPALARTISGSREAIWGMLADPEKFNSLT